MYTVEFVSKDGLAVFCRSFSHMERTAGTLRHHHIRRPSDGREDGSAHLLRASKVSRSSKVTKILATVPAVPTQLARSAPPARCPEPASDTIYRIPLPRSPDTTPMPLPLPPLCPTALYHAMLWYIPSMRTRVPTFGQTFPNKVGPCQNHW